MCRIKRGNPTATMFIDPAGEKITKLDACYLEDDESPDLIANPTKYSWEKIMKRNFPQGYTWRQFAEAMGDFMNVAALAPKIQQICNEKHGAFFLYEGLVMTGYESLFNGPRGIKKLSLDLRRRKKEVIEYGRMMYETSVLPSLQQIAQHHIETACADVNFGMLGHSILNISSLKISTGQR